MGLDSVELLIENEIFFNIRILNHEAEKIYTIQNFVDVIAQHLKVESEGMYLQEKVFSIFRVTLRQVKNIKTEIKLKDKISVYLNPDEPAFYLNFTNELKLQTPRLTYDNKCDLNIIEKLKKLMNWKPNYDWRKLSVEDFINAICIKNYKLLINSKNIKSKYEIYVGVAGITADKTGVDYFEIAPEKSFTYDLGVD